LFAGAGRGAVPVILPGRFGIQGEGLAALACLRLVCPVEMSEVLVIGHRNPDTDAICSAIGYAEFKRRAGMPNAVPARCGDTNERIDFVLQTFGMPAPKFVADVSPKVRDVMQT